MCFIGLKDDKDPDYYDGAKDILDELAALNRPDKVKYPDLAHFYGMVERRLNAVMDRMREECGPKEVQVTCEVCRGLCTYHGELCQCCQGSGFQVMTMGDPDPFREEEVIAK